MFSRPKSDENRPMMMKRCIWLTKNETIRLILCLYCHRSLKPGWFSVHRHSGNDLKPSFSVYLTEICLATQASCGKSSTRTLILGLTCTKCSTRGRFTDGPSSALCLGLFAGCVPVFAALMHSRTFRWKTRADRTGRHAFDGSVDTFPQSSFFRRYSNWFKTNGRKAKASLWLSSAFLELNDGSEPRRAIGQGVDRNEIGNRI